jgi:nucleoside-diphosphate-sugar epimerase
LLETRNTLKRVNTVLVTGATGFIGSHLVEQLLESGLRVRVLTRPAARAKNALSDSPNLERFAAPLTVEGMTRAAIGCAVVYHLAGITRASSEAEFMWVNAEGTRAAAVGAQRSGARLVYVSSLAAAGTGTPDAPRHVSDSPAPITAYGRSKLEGEVRVRETPDLEFAILRPPGVYGERDTDFLFAFQAAKYGLFPVLGNPERSYTLVYAHDLVRSIIACGSSPAAVGNTYFAGNPRPVAWKAILETIATVSGKTYKPLKLPDFALEVAAGAGELWRVFGQTGLINRSRQADLQAPGWVCDVSAAERDLGVICDTPLNTGFAQTLDWYKRHRWL